MRDSSPLRYPGGKWKWTSFFERYINLNSLDHCYYVEPYAGGASLALSLLLRKRVSMIYINDLDPAIYSFWDAILNHTSRFLDMVESTPLTPKEWYRQKAIYRHPNTSKRFELGFATFFLNRTNHSGILNGGMIGGIAQNGDYKLDARFNRYKLIERITRIAKLKTHIHISSKDAICFLAELKLPRPHLVYLDPPYYHAGHRLYMNYYKQHDHAKLRDFLRKRSIHWVVSYDECPTILGLYQGFRTRRFSLLHTARSTKMGREIMVFSPLSRIPSRQTR